ncbi:MAG: ATP-binding protein [Saprospiraceae bacterium]|uniref:ATP-binding protein n=1 Tax=Candidatus Opimibacter skivensis TaxID=2982028 RepID=A0A9D7SWK0_9BACT|nr:ATP-binding protein [Candidatus Opimibacter skivensis]
MKRDIDARLLQWKESVDHKPLIVRGARQVGKSWSISEFGRSFTGRTHLVNLEKRPDWHGIFELNLDAKRILAELEIVLNNPIRPGEDLLFIDEIQACPKAISALRYFFEQVPGLHVICAGSLLEFALRDLPFPVGRVQLMDMYPMHFAEFLEATGQSMLANVILSRPEKISETIHKSILESLKIYFDIGGMPACVAYYAETRSILRVREIQDDLLATMRQDFLKYTPYVNTNCLNDILSAVAGSTGQQISYTRLSQHYTSPTNKKAFDLLITARVIYKVACISPLSLPLREGASLKKFKALFLDIGLLSRLQGVDMGYRTDYHSLFRGAIAEQFVGQELVASRKGIVYYWAREAKSSQAEIDFLIDREGVLIPIEVKSGASGRLKSLHLLLNEHAEIPHGYILSEGAYGQIPDQRLTYMPIYFAGYLGRGDG